MPQLDFNVAFSNFLYLISFFFFFYLFFSFFFLPQLFKIFSIHFFLRKKYSNNKIIFSQNHIFILKKFNLELVKLFSFLKL